MNQPKVTIVTAVRNSARTVADAIESVRAQTYPNIEHLIVDGASTDGTLNIVRKYSPGLAGVVSEPDRGVYDGMNKGLRLATGEIVGTLNADDFYAHARVIETVVHAMEESRADVAWGDLEYVDANRLERVVRHWRSSPYRPGLFRGGWMPPHPTFFARRSAYERHGYFQADMRIAADYELMLRFLERGRLPSRYIPEVLVKMRLGGVSNRSLRNIALANREAREAWRRNRLSPAPWTIPLKVLRKLVQFV